MKNRKFYLYKITNLVNGKIYIGKTFSPTSRWRNHLDTAKHKFSNTYSYIHKAINKYGKENFLFEVILGSSFEDEILQQEKNFIQYYNSYDGNYGYNLTLGGDGISGYKYTPEQTEALSKRMKGVFKGEKNPFYGKTHSEETRKRLSESGKKRDKKNYLGEKCSQSKLTEEQVILIKNKFLNENLIEEELAKQFNVKRQCVNSILRNKTWSHVGHKIELSNQDKVQKAWNARLGEFKDFEYTCEICKKIFVKRRREFAKQMTANKFCSNECKWVRLSRKG